MSRDLLLEERFAGWLREYPAIPQKLSRAYTFNETDTADLHQEMLVQLWRSLPRFENQAKPSTWIYRVCLNTALTWQRDRRRYANRTATVEHDVSTTAAPGPGPADERDREERIEALWQAVRALPSADRSLIVLALDGLSHREIAEITGMTENHVGVALLRSRRKLAITLKGMNHEL